MTEKNIKFLNFGSLNTDMVYTVDHTVRPGETTASSKLEYFCGGKGLNQSIALSRAGARIFHAGCVGSDGDRLIEQLEINGIDVHLVKKADMPSGHAIIQVDKNGQNSILLFGGANKQISPEHIAAVLSDFKAGDRLFLQNEINNVDKIISAASEKKMDIVFNPSPFGKEIQTFPLDKVSWFVVNETEALTSCSRSAATAHTARRTAKHIFMIFSMFPLLTRPPQATPSSDFSSPRLTAEELKKP